MSRFFQKSVNKGSFFAVKCTSEIQFHSELPSAWHAQNGSWTNWSKNKKRTDRITLLYAPKLCCAPHSGYFPLKNLSAKYPSQGTKQVQTLQICFTLLNSQFGYRAPPYAQKRKLQKPIPLHKNPWKSLTNNKKSHQSKNKSQSLTKSQSHSFT